MKPAFEKLQNFIESLEGGEVSASRPLDHEDFEAKHARGIELGARRRAATVLRDEDFDACFAHQLNFVVERKRPAREQKPMIRQGRCRLRPVDGADEIVMLRRDLESGKLLAADGQKDAPWRWAEGMCGARCIRDYAPAIAGHGPPSRTCEDRERNLRLSRSRGCVGGHLLGKRMRGVDQHVDPICAQIGDKPFDAAEAADAVRHIRQLGTRRATGKRKDRSIARVDGESHRQRIRLRRAAEDQNAHGFAGGFHE